MTNHNLINSSFGCDAPDRHFTKFTPKVSAISENCAFGNVGLVANNLIESTNLLKNPPQLARTL